MSHDRWKRGIRAELAHLLGVLNRFEGLRMARVLAVAVVTCVLSFGTFPITLNAQTIGPNAEMGHRLYLPLIDLTHPACGSTPCLLAPADGAQINTLLPTFSWDAGPQNATSFLHICTTPAVPCGSCYPSCPVVAGSGIQSVRAAENLPARQVWWAVEVVRWDRNGLPISDEFTRAQTLNVAGELPLLPAPALIGPSGTVTPTVTFKWEAVPGALDYKLCHWGEKGWPCYHTKDTELQLTFAAYENQYRWWVEARNAYGYSAHHELWVHIKPAASTLTGQVAR